MKQLHLLYPGLFTKARARTIAQCYHNTWIHAWDSHWWARSFSFGLIGSGQARDMILTIIRKNEEF